MLETPINWDSLWELDNTICTYKIEIGDNVYTGLEDIEGDTLKFFRTLFTAEALIGNTPCFSMECCLRLGGTQIPKGAILNVWVALKNGDIVTSYIPSGTFKVYRRIEYPDGWVKLTCRDKMQMANQAYFPTAIVEGEWPKSMKTVIKETAERIGVEIDPRTNIHEGDNWMVYPPVTKTIRQVWSYIASAHGGNFCITPEDKLLLAIPKAYAEEAHELSCSEGGFESLGEAVYVDKIDLVVDSKTTISRGQSGTNNITIDCPYANDEVADFVKQRLTGVLYYPVKVSDIVINPALEIQDSYLVNGVLTTWGSLDSNCGIIPLSDGTSESLMEPDSEYGFEDTPSNQLTIEIDKAKDYTDDAIKRQTQKDIFDKLTNNGQAQGLFLSANGELFLNINYISAGIISSQDGKVFYLDLDSGILDMQVKALTIAGKSIKDVSLEGLSQEEAFNKLTDNGNIKGIIMRDGQMYVNASYIDTGSLNADLIKAGCLKSQHDNGETFTLDLEKGTFHMSGSGKFMSEDGKAYMTMDGNSFVLHAKDKEGEWAKIAKIGFSEDSAGVDYPYMLLGHAVDTAEETNLSLVKAFSNGIYIGNAIPKLNTGNFLGLPGAVGFFVDIAQQKTYNVVGDELYDAFTAVFG